MYSYTTSDSRVTRTLDESIGLIESDTEVWIIVHISESIVVGEERKSWWW